MRQHLFQRFLARADGRDFVLQAVDFQAQFGREAALFSQFLLGSPPLAGHRFQFQLPFGQGGGDLFLEPVQTLDFGRRGLLFARRARGFPVDAGQVFVDLRQLVLERRSFAQQA